ncbi:hypothetical protein PTTG_30474 [Puccinia triticina 1-1 BBBD Race 1]|uniref:Uncharacterized protein n=1 Tax=Puccinia triticina (isolate 1-1 / race 1 (BBBD)) TaxID=630390 RepID=A0A180FYM0_PUCT1|nr:hypothetical protein PTTG_30474 [Puccinia triticina 1-1 BBBD Race 1]
MSIEAEINSIHLQLGQLQIRLTDLESRFKPIPSNSKQSTRPETVIAGECPLTSGNISGLSASTRGHSSASSRSYGTLRSRSFKVMRHLINVVDLSNFEDVAGKHKKIHRKRVNFDDSATSLPPTSKARMPSNPKSVPITQSNVLRNCHPKRPSKKRTDLTAKSDVPRIYHPKRPRVDPKALVEQLSEETHTIDADPPTNQPGPTTPQPKLDDQTLQRPIAEPFEYNDLKRWSTRYALLKNDPNVLDLLPTSRKTLRFIPTSIIATIKEIPQKSKKLLESQILGIWELKEGTSTAQLYEYTRPDDKTSIEHQAFKFTGFAWKGHLGQQPPRIKDLSDDISQGSRCLRWYWFKDLWLLYYFDD